MADQESMNLDLPPERIYAVMCYCAILVLFPLMMYGQHGPFVRFHIRQGLTLLIVITLSIMAAFWWPPSSLIFALLMVVDLMALVQALHGKSWKIPVLGHISERFSI